MTDFEELNTKVVQLFANCKEVSDDTGSTAEILIKNYLQLIEARTADLFLEEFNSSAPKKYSDFDNLILSLHKILAAELDEIETLLVYAENSVSSFQNTVSSILNKIMDSLYNLHIFLPLCNIGEKLKILDILYRLFGIILYFRTIQCPKLLEFTELLLKYDGQIRKSYLLFLEILMYLIKNFNSRRIEAIDLYLLELNTIEVETQEELSFLLLVKGLLNYYRGKMYIALEIYEQYALLSHHSYTYLHEYFCLKVSLGAMTLEDYNFSYGIIQSFRIATKYKGKMHVAIRWLSHSAFLLLHKRNFIAAKQCMDEAEKFLAKVSANVPASFIRRAKAYYWYLQEEYQKAIQIINEDSEKSFVNGKLIAPMTDPHIIEMMFDLQMNKGANLGNYSIENLVDYYLSGVSCVTIGIAYYWRSCLAQDKREKKLNLEKAFKQVIQSGCIELIEQMGTKLLACVSEKERKFVQEKIAYWQAKKNTHQELVDTAPFYSTYNCLNMLLALENNVQNYFNIQQFLLVLQKELSAQRLAFFEIDKQKEVWLGSINFSPIETEKFSFASIKEKAMSALNNPALSPEYALLSDCIGIFCFPKNAYSVYVLYLENDLHEGVFLGFNEMEKKAFSWFLHCFIRSNVSRFQPTAIASSYNTTFKYQKELEPYWGDDMGQILEKVRNIAYTDMPILITGETGVGKEQLASYIHKNSRVNMPFICVHLASVPAELFESELFGHEKGAFTGALQQKKGVFELAHNGTLFLDEIADVPMPMQIKLLRVLQDKKFNRVGGNEQIFSNFRLILATNKDLWKEVMQGNFREDLYYRISMVTILIPSLRERKKDFPMLVQHIYSYYCAKYDKEMNKIPKSDYQKLYNHVWKGNVRELCSVLEKYVVLGELEFYHNEAEQGEAQQIVSQKEVDGFALSEPVPSLEEVEKQYIIYVLKKTKGKIYGSGGALEILNMKKSTFYNRLEQYSINLKSLEHFRK